MSDESRPANLSFIDDLADPRLEDYRDLRERDRAGREGRPELFVGESLLVVRKMLARPGLTKSVLLAENQVDRVIPYAPDAVPVYAVSSALMRRVAGFDVHRGILAVGRRPAPECLTLDAVVPRRPGPLTVLLCEGINNIDNMGMLFRNAAAFAVDAVLLCPRSHDPLYRKSVRVSIGHVLSVPWARSSVWEDDLHRLQSTWALTLIGATSSGPATTLDELETPQRVGVIVGNEFDGLASATLARCDHLVRIPMAPGVDSLNVQVAAAVLLHRFSRGSRV